MLLTKFIRLSGAFFPSLIFNVSYFGLRVGLRFPVIVSHRVWFKRLSGTVVIPEKAKFGTIKIGFQDVGIFDSQKCRSIWDVSGAVTFVGKCDLGHGVKISVGSEGQLEFGAGVRVTAESSIVCQKRIILGDGCLVSWEVLLMDTDFHKIIDSQGREINEDKTIALGKQVWVGCRCTILKGVTLAEGTIVAAGTVVHKSISQPSQIVGGAELRVIKSDARWQI